MQARPDSFDSATNPSYPMKAYVLLLSVPFLFAACAKEQAAEPDLPLPAADTYPGSILAGQTTGDGILHVDFSPELYFTGVPWPYNDTIYLDLDSNQVNDFMLKYTMSDPLTLGHTHETLDIIPLGTNQVCVSPNDSTLAEPLELDALIDDARTWSTESAILFHYSSSQAGGSTTVGHFNGPNDYYVGIQFNADGQVRYGWINTCTNCIEEYGITIAY